MAETQPLRIPIGLDTKDVQKDAQDIKKKVEDAFNSSAMQNQNKELQKIAQSMKQTYKQAEDLEAKLQELKNVKVYNPEYLEIQEQIDKDTAALQKLSNKMYEFKEWGGDTKSDAFHKMEVQADELRNSIEYAQGELQDLVDTGKAFTIGDTEGIAKVEEQLDVVNDKLKVQLGNYDEAISKGKEVATSLKPLKDIWGAVVNTMKSALNVFSQIGVAGKNIIGVVKKLATHMKSVSDNTERSNFSFKKLAGTLLGVTLGAQGLVSIFRKLASAAREGFTNLTKESLQAANSLNLLSAKFMQLKNSVGAAIAPLANMVIPVITRIIDLFTRAFNAVAMFFGALTGKSSVQIAKTLDASAAAGGSGGSGGSSNGKTAEEKYQEAVAKAQAQYDKELAKYQEKVAKAEEKQAKAAAKLAKEQEKANGQLASFDELNNLTSDSLDDANDSLDDYLDGLEEPELILPDRDDFEDALGGGGGGLADMFEEAIIGDGIQNLADKFKKILADLLEPLKKAWDDVGDFVINSWKKAWNSVKDLVRDVWRDFITVWKQPETVEIFRNILRIIGDIGLAISGLADKIREAWNYNQTGLHILEHIRNIIGTIVEWIRKAADYTVGWINTLDFKPLFTSIEKFLGALEPVVDSVMGVLYDFYTMVLLPLGKWVIEKGLPQLVDILTYLAENIPWDKLREDLAELWEHLEPFAERVGQGLIDFIKGLAERLAEWTNSGKFEEFLQKIEDWMDDVSAEDVKDLADELFGFVEVIGRFIGIIADVAAQIGAENLAKIAMAIFTYKTLNLGGIASSIGKFVVSLGKLIGTAAVISKLGGIKGLVSTLFGKGATAEAATVAAESGTAVGEAAVTGATTAIEGGAVATGAALTGMAAVGVGAFGVLAATGNKYADDMRETLDTYEIDQYGDTLEGLKQKFSDTADTISGKCEEIREKSTASFGDASASAALYSETSRLQEAAIQNVRDAEDRRAQAMANLTMYETDQNQLIREGAKVSDELRVKIDEAKHEVEATTEAYDIANSALSEVKDTMEFVVGQYSATSDAVSSYSKEYADEQAKIQMANNNLKGDYSNTSTEVISSVDTMKTEVSTKMDEMSTELGESGTSGADAYADNFVAENNTRLGDYTQSGIDDMEGFQSGVESQSDGTFSWWGTFFQSLIDAAKSIFDSHSPSVVMHNIGIDVFTGLLNGFKSMGDQIMTWISNFIQNIVNAFSDLGQMIGDTISGWKDSLDNFSLSGTISNIGGRISNKIHGYASGQVIPPGMSEHLAILGDNNQETEVVSPLSTMREAFLDALTQSGFTGTSNNNAPIVIQIDGREVFRAVRDQNAIYQNQTGESAFA